ncbi:hypothetical protein [Flavobacterium sp.]|uniref:hypothetical protein n=1 Tax=Flavobacterium sp. TaxID=239 RepID=UPI003753E04E
MPKEEQQLLIYNNSIHANFKNFKRKYSVEISIDGESNDDLNIISYKTQVNYTKDVLKPYFLAEVTITDFLLNFKYPDSTMQIIALKCRETIEKCVFQVNTKNEIIALENYKEIVEKWRNIKERIVQEYEGEIVDKYLAVFEKSLENETVVLEKIKKNLFVNQYFFPIFDEPYHGFEKKGIEIFSFFDLDYQEEVLIQLENQGDYDENGKAVVTKKLVRNQSNTEFFPIEDYQTKYTLNKERYIEKIEGEFLIKNNKYSFEIR